MLTDATIHEMLDLCEEIGFRMTDDRVGLAMLDCLEASLRTHLRDLLDRSHAESVERQRIARETYDLEQRFVSEMRAANEQLVALSEQLGVTL
jgi:hypothetical protein